MGNLLDITRIEAGALRTSPEPCDIQEVVSAVLDRLGSRLDGRAVEVEVPSVLLPMDFVSDGAGAPRPAGKRRKYSPPGTPIGVEAKVIGSTLEIAVLDRGYGVPAEDLERIFDKFYRVQRPQGISGTGLGLAICQGIVEAHHGRIWAQNRSGGGTIVMVALPCEPAAPTGLAEDAPPVSVGPAVEAEVNGSVHR